MNKDEILKKLKKHKDESKDYSNYALMNEGYRSAMMDAIDIVKNLTIPNVPEPMAYNAVLAAVVGLNMKQKHELAAMWIDGIREQGMKTLETLFALDDERSKVYNKHRIESGFTSARLLATKHCLNLIYGG